MAQPQLLQGSLEEFLSHEELKGRDDLLLIVPARDNGTTSAAGENADEEKSLAELFAGRVGRVSFEPRDVAARSEEYFGKLMLQKHQANQGAEE